MEKSRVELFDLVWSKPMTHLAKELGLSDVGLRKICVKFGFHFRQEATGQGFSLASKIRVLSCHS